MNFFESTLFKYGFGIVCASIAIFALSHSFDAKSKMGWGGDQIAQITVNGTGEAFAVADTALFSFDIQKEAKVPADSQKAVNEILNPILAKLKALGIEDKDIKTQNYSTYPVYENEAVTFDRYCINGCPNPGTPSIRGYQTSASVTVKVRKSETAGDVIAEVTSIGATSVGGVQFVVDDEDAVRAEARKDAIAQAKAKAQVLADDLGVRLVKIVSFNEDGGYYPVAYMKSAAMDMAVSEAGSAPELPKGENQYSANVSITYEIR